MSILALSRIDIKSLSEGKLVTGAICDLNRPRPDGSIYDLESLTAAFRRACSETKYRQPDVLGNRERVIFTLRLIDDETSAESMLISYFRKDGLVIDPYIEDGILFGSIILFKPVRITNIGFSTDTVWRDGKNVVESFLGFFFRARD